MALCPRRWMGTRLTGLSLVLPAFILSFALLAIRSGAQAAPFIQLADGRTVEVIGLKRWTIAMIQDSLRKYSPGTSLESNACARVLRYELHFADASAGEYKLGNRPNQIVVTVREPQDSVQVHHRMMSNDTLGGRREWRTVTDVVRNHANIFYPAMHTFVARIAGQNGHQRYRTAGDSATAAEIVSFLMQRRSQADRRLALRSLARDSRMTDRMVAALILANFPSNDETWWALIEALREDDGWVIGVAANVLSALSAAPRPIDWRPKNEAIRVMLDGTGLFGLPALIQTLNATEVGPANARAFLHNGGEMLTAYLGSSNPILAESSYSLLVKLRGRDLGREVAPWRTWIASLRE